MHTSTEEAEISDAALIELCRKNERGAWEKLIRRYQRLVFTVPRRAGLDEHTAADVFQTVFAKLFENLNKLNQPDRVQAWLVTTARFESLRLVASQKRGRQMVALDDDEQAFEVADHALLPDQVLENLQDQRSIAAAMEKIDERSRSFLTELFLREEPLSYEALAAKFEISVGSIGPTRARCLEKLRNAMQ